MTNAFGISARRYLAETVIGLLMIPLSLVPFVLYLGGTDDGYLMYLRGRYQIFAPGTPGLSPQDLAAARAEQRNELAGVPVLVYHGIGRETDAAHGEGMVVSRAHFAEQMRTLANAGYRPITTKDLARYLATGDERPIPRKPILLTFDDGRSDAMIQADKILADTGMRATMFVIGSAAESEGFYYESAERLAAHHRSGRWELANHTDDLHHRIDAADDATSALVERRTGEGIDAYGDRVGADLDRAQTAVEEITGERPLAFAYPFGEWGDDALPATAAALGSVVEKRFELAFDQDGQAAWRPALPGDDPMHVHRLQVGDWSGDHLLERLEDAARRSAAVYAERALGYEYSAAELADAGSRLRCGTANPRPVLDRHDLVGRKLVALTFSGGPSVVTPSILDALRRDQAVATFFAEPSGVKGRENLLRRALVEGHELGVTAGSLRSPGPQRPTRAADVQAAAQSVEAAIGTPPCLVRPGPDVSSSRLAALAAGLGFGTILWSVDPGDFDESSSSEIARRVLRDAKSGSIVVLHDAHRQMTTAKALPLIVEGLRARGYRLVTVSELLRARDERRLQRAPRGKAARPAAPRTSERRITGARPSGQAAGAPTRTRARTQRPADTASAGSKKAAPRLRKPPPRPAPPPSTAVQQTTSPPPPAPVSSPPVSAAPVQPSPAPSQPAPAAAPAPPAPPPAPATPEPPAPAPWPGNGNGRDWDTPPGKEKDHEPPGKGKPGGG